MPRTGQQQVVTAPTLQKGAFHLSEGAQRPDAHEFRLPITPLPPWQCIIYTPALHESRLLLYSSFKRRLHFFQDLRVCRQVSHIRPSS